MKHNFPPNKNKDRVTTDHLSESYNLQRVSIKYIRIMCNTDIATKKVFLNIFSINHMLPSSPLIN